MDLRERVARAICAGNIKYNGAWESRSLDERIEDEWSRWLPEADAALAAVLDALKEPTMGMVSAAYGDDDFWNEATATEIWQAMLSAFRTEALGEG